MNDLIDFLLFSKKNDTVFPGKFLNYGHILRVLKARPHKELLRKTIPQREKKMARELYAFRSKDERVDRPSFTYKALNGVLVNGIHAVSAENKCPILGPYTLLGVVREYVSTEYRNKSKLSTELPKLEQNSIHGLSQKAQKKKEQRAVKSKGVDKGESKTMFKVLSDEERYLEKCPTCHSFCNSIYCRSQKAQRKKEQRAVKTKRVDKGEEPKEKSTKSKHVLNLQILQNIDASSGMSEEVECGRSVYGEACIGKGRPFEKCTKCRQYIDHY